MIASLVRKCRVRTSLEFWKIEIKLSLYGIRILMIASLVRKCRVRTSLEFWKIEIKPGKNGKKS